MAGLPRRHCAFCEINDYWFTRPSHDRALLVIPLRVHDNRQYGHRMSSGTARYRLGVDVGGTHTDLVLLDTTSGRLLVEKVASTPKNPALGVLDGVARFVAKG